MRHLWKKTGWLVMAAALTWGMASCSADDSIIEQQPQPQPETTVGKTLHVTVSAGIADDATTRSTVDYNAETKQRTLQFTAGDRLYVRGGIGAIQNDGYDDYYNNIIAGYLDIDASSINGATATFSGDLQVYEVSKEEHLAWDFNEETGEEYSWVTDIYYSYPDDNIVDATGFFNHPSDPLPECHNVTAVLVHKDAGDNIIFNGDGMRELCYSVDLAADVNTLMTTILYVTGSYSNGSFTLANGAPRPILNCTVTGLTANATYKVSYSATSGSTPEFNTNFGSTTEADETGTATFAFFGNGDENYYHTLRLKNTSDASDVMHVNIGQKALATTKVYNVTRAATEPPFYVKNSDTGAFLEMVNGTYTLEEGCEYYINCSGRGNITSTTTTRGKTTRLRLYDSPILKGTVRLEASGDGNAILILFSGNATISNPGQVALQTGSKATSVITNGYVLTVDGDISGSFCLYPGSTLRVSGSVENADIRDYNRATITPVVENGYKVYYYNPIDVYAYAQGNYTVTFDKGAPTTLTDTNDTRIDENNNEEYYKYSFNAPYGATSYTITDGNHSWGPVTDMNDIVIYIFCEDEEWKYEYQYQWDLIVDEGDEGGE